MISITVIYWLITGIAFVDVPQLHGFLALPASHPVFAPSQVGEYDCMPNQPWVDPKAHRQLMMADHVPIKHSRHPITYYKHQTKPQSTLVGISEQKLDQLA